MTNFVKCLRNNLILKEKSTIVEAIKPKNNYMYSTCSLSSKHYSLSHLDDFFTKEYPHEDGVGYFTEENIGKTLIRGDLVCKNFSSETIESLTHYQKIYQATMNPENLIILMKNHNNAVYDFIATCIRESFTELNHHESFLLKDDVINSSDQDMN